MKTHKHKWYNIKEYPLGFHCDCGAWTADKKHISLPDGKPMEIVKDGN